jgi:YjbR
VCIVIAPIFSNERDLFLSSAGSVRCLPSVFMVMMTDTVRNRVIAACSAKPGSVEDYPFDDEAAVFKVVGKMFALVALGPGSVSLKYDPDLAAGLRGRYAAITAGYHLNKRH